MDPIGKSPVPLPLLILGKLAMLVCWLFFVVKSLSPESMQFDGPVTVAAGVVLFVAGFFVAGLSIRNLGKSISVGLPRMKTELKTHGLYRFTRNPIYLGAFFMCAGSCLYAIHLVNFILFAITFCIHHRIIKKEELFLDSTFGQEWREYALRTPRYLGIGTRKSVHQ